MKLKTIEGLAIDTIDWTCYDAIFAGSGFEGRSIFFSSKIPSEFHYKLVVIGFSSDRNTLSRPENDAWFQEVAKVQVSVPNSTNEVENLLYGTLNAISTDTLRVAVDYSTMTRDWYGRLLTWAKYQSRFDNVVLDFFYSHGQYSSSFDHLQIKDILCVPGYEGVGAGARYTTAFFGLGFDGGATCTVGELIEADKLVCFVARGGEVDPHADEVLSKNREILRESKVDPINLPFSDVRRATSILLENIGPHCNDSDKVLLIPMGPKPHILASLLACQVIPKVACLHVKGVRDKPVQVLANGTISGTRISYRR